MKLFALRRSPSCRKARVLAGELRLPIELGQRLLIIALVLNVAASTRSATALEASPLVAAPSKAGPGPLKALPSSAAPSPLKALPSSAGPRPLIALPSSGEARAEAAAANEVRWRDEWARVRWWEYAGTATLMTSAFLLRFAGPPPPDNWRGGILFDDVILRNVAIEDQSAARGVELTTDVLFYGAMGYRLIDSVFVPLLGYQDPDLALQMAMIDLGAFSVQAIVLWGSQTLVGRTRPLALRCDNLPPDMQEERCAIPSRLGPQRSFIAGHPATGFTAAGLTCQHHRHIPLYGGWGDSAACATTLVAATINGLGRVLAEQHYPTDLALGVALGTFSGWVLPGLLHYGFGPSEKDPGAARSSLAATSRSFSLTVLPDVQEDRLGATLLGLF